MHIYKTFREAAQYAKEIAQKNSQTVRIVKNESGYIVSLSSQAIKQPLDVAGTNLEEYIEQGRKWRKEIEYRQKLAEVRYEEEKKRKDYLKERKTYYESLSEKKLELIWSERANSEIENDELYLIRNILRKIKGISGKENLNIKVCGGCYHPIDSCTCERGWW